jgi:DNA-binding response OmpR family regulator
MKTRLLVADADKAMSGLCRAYLSHFGYQVDTAMDGAECLSKLRRRPPDLLLLDLGLPGGGGETILVQLRDNEGPRIPVVMMADLMPFNALSGLRKPPVVRCVQKPIRIATLCNCIDSLVHPRRKRSKRDADADRSVTQRGEKKTRRPSERTRPESPGVAGTRG